MYSRLIWDTSVGWILINADTKVRYTSVWVYCSSLTSVVEQSSCVTSTHKRELSHMIAQATRVRCAAAKLLTSAGTPRSNHSSDYTVLYCCACLRFTGNGLLTQNSSLAWHTHTHACRKREREAERKENSTLSRHWFAAVCGESSRQRSLHQFTSGDCWLDVVGAWGGAAERSFFSYSCRCAVQWTSSG